MVLALRHGDTVIDSRFSGWTPVPLTAAGVSKAMDSARQLRATRFAAIYSSDIPAAVTTANALSQLTGGQKVVQDPTLRSLNAGQLTGIDDDKTQAVLQRLFQSPGSRIPGGESINDWAGRVIGRVQPLLASTNLYGVVTHSKNVRLLSGFIRSGGDVSSRAWEMGEAVDPGEAVLLTPSTAVKLDLNSGGDNGEDGGR